tara:strand:- start:61 stop:225 length:165 start_codon:yes stop_codon:yes gene_type:complete
MPSSGGSKNRWITPSDRTSARALQAAHGTLRAAQPPLAGRAKKCGANAARFGVG